MGKIVGKITGILSIFLLAVFLTLQTPVALANEESPQDSCGEIETNPKQGELNEKSPKVTLTIDISDNSHPPYQVETRCGPLLYTKILRTRKATPIPTTTKISAIIENGLNNCSFSVGLHEIWVESGNSNVCKTSYEVVSSDTLCKLSIPRTSFDPLSPDFDKSSMPAKDLQIKGENLLDRQFRLFFDNQIVKIRDGQFPNDLNYYLDKPTFTVNLSGVPQPPPFLTRPGKHRIDIRRYYSHSNPVPFFQENGPALCPLDFIVEAPDKPVKILSEQDLKECKSGPLCSSGASLECQGESKPAVRTAIGCIHTNPADLIADVLKFGVGIGGGLAFLMMLLGAFQMLTSAGNPETLQAGKDRLTSAIIGLLVIIFSVLLLQIIGVDILGILGR